MANLSLTDNYFKEISNSMNSVEFWNSLNETEKTELTHSAQGKTLLQKYFPDLYFEKVLNAKLLDEDMIKINIENGENIFRISDNKKEEPFLTKWENQNGNEVQVAYFKVKPGDVIIKNTSDSVKEEYHILSLNDKTFAVKNDFNEKPQLIATHPNPHHLDDFLGVIAYAEAKGIKDIHYVHPQDKTTLDAFKKMSKVALIDVGGDYSPEYNNFDHHQNQDIPSSLVLVLKELNMLYNHPAIKIIDEIDRFGFPAAVKKYGLKSSPEINQKRQMLLINKLYNEKGEKNEEFFKTVFSELKKVTTINPDFDKIQTMDELISVIYDSLDKKGLLEDVKRQMEKEEQMFQKRLNEASVQDIFGFKVVFSDESFAPKHSLVFDKLDADIIVEKNKMNPAQTSIIKNTKKEEANMFDFQALKENYPVTFVHQTGFIAVINQPVEDFKKPDKLTELIQDSLNKNLFSQKMGKKL
jgi:hypothetical protein